MYIYIYIYIKRERELTTLIDREKDIKRVEGERGLVWFLCLMTYQLILGYLMPKPFS